MSSIAFNLLQNSCRYQSYIKGGQLMCGFKDGKTALCWDDWQTCTATNCFLICKKKSSETTNQQTIFDYMEES